MASVNRTDSILPLFPFTDGEKLSILINRYKNLTGVSAADLSTRAGYTRTYIPKLIARKMLKPKQRKLVAAALEIPAFSAISPKLWVIFAQYKGSVSYFAVGSFK